MNYEQFEKWYNEDEHDLYNYPEDAMKEAWDAAIDEAVQTLELMIFNSNNEYREEALDDAVELIKQLKQ